MNENTDDTETRTLTLRAEVTILAGERAWSGIEDHIPAELPVNRFATVEDYLDAVSSNVAVALLSPRLSDEAIEAVVRQTLSESEHARVALVATDGGELLQCDVPHEDSFVIPDEVADFSTAIKHLYVRAYYCVMVDRYYKLSLAIKNHELRPESETNEEKLDQLQGSHQRAESYLEQFRHFLDQEDFEAMKRRDRRYSDVIGPTSTADPSAFDLPEACPDCGLDWTTWHGPQRQIGYEQIGANTWRCTDCGHILADNDPDNYKVG